MNLKTLAILTIALMICGGDLSTSADEGAKEAPTVSSTPASVLDTARTYLETLYRFDWEAVTPLLAEDALFEDPTSVIFGTETSRLEGRKAILDFFKNSSAGIGETSFEVLRSFSTGEYAIFELVYRTEGDGAVLGYPGLPMKLKVPGTTILQVRDGKVVHHLDHIDYESLLRQVEEQAAGATEPL